MFVGIQRNEAFSLQYCPIINFFHKIILFLAGLWEALKTTYAPNYFTKQWFFFRQRFYMEQAILLSKRKHFCAGELAIGILSREWPLNMRSIQWRISRKHGKQVSFQAVHKSLNRLVDQGVLVKDCRKYKLSVQWLDEIARFSAETKKAYAEKEINLRVEQKSTERILIP